MGFFSGTKKVLGQVVNFKVQDWIDAKYHKNFFTFIGNYSKSLFTKNPIITKQETFEEAIKRLNLSEEDLIKRKKEFSKLFSISLIVSVGLFSYTMFITIKYSNFYSFILGASVTAMSLANTFKYHFWLTQINKRKLGLSFQEWLDQ